MASARTITPVNIRLGLDVTKIREGMAFTGTELRNLSRLTAQSADGFTRLSYATDLFDKAVSKGNMDANDAQNILENLAAKYGVQTQKAKDAAEAKEAEDRAQKKLNQTLKEASQIMQSLQSSSETFAQKEEVLQTATEEGAITKDQYLSSMKKLRAEYDMLSPKEQEAANAARNLQNARKTAESAARGLVTAEELHNEKAEAAYTLMKNGEMTREGYVEYLKRLDRQIGVVGKEEQELINKQKRLDEEQERAAKALREYQNLMDRAGGSLGRYKKAKEELFFLYRQEKLSLDEVRAAMKQLNTERAREKKNEGGQGVLGTMVSGRALATGAAFAGVAAVGAGAREIMSLTMQQEETFAMTKALTGNEAATQSLLASYRQLDRESMLSFANFGKAGKEMLAVGMSTQEVTPMLEGLGKVSGGNEERFDSLVRAMTQVQTAGKLTASEMLQFTNAGWNPLNEIAKRSGETMAQTRKRIEEGAVSVQEVKLALMAATTAGGAFANVNEEMQQTFSGQWAKFQSDLQAGAIEFGTSLIPAFKEFMGLLKGSGETLGIILAPIKAMINGFATLAAFAKGGFEGVQKFMDAQDELARQKEFEKEAAKQKTQSQSDYMSQLSSEKAMNDANKKVLQEQEAHRKEITKLEEQTSEAIEKKWYAAKYGEEAELQRLRDKISLAGQVTKLSTADQDYVNQKRLDEIKALEAADEQSKKQEKLMENMRHEIAATEELIRLRRGGLVVSEEDLKKHEKMKEFGDSQARSEYEKMYNRKIALETEEKRLKEIREEGKKNQEKFQKPDASFRENVGKLLSQRKVGALSQDAFEGAGMDLAKTFMQALNPQNVSSSTAPTLRAGSAEAYKFLQEQNERRAQRAEQKALFEKMIMAIERGNDINRNKGVVGTIRN
jgi:tape measure domain-containing protein